MALYKARIIRTQNLGNNQLIEKDMEVQFSYFGHPWDGGAGPKAINDAFLRVYGIDLKANNVLGPGFVEVEKIKNI